MINKRTVLALMLIAALILGISSSAFADDHITTEPIITPNTNPYEYATAQTASMCLFTGDIARILQASLIHLNAQRDFSMCMIRKLTRS